MVVDVFWQSKDPPLPVIKIERTMSVDAQVEVAGRMNGEGEERTFPSDPTRGSQVVACSWAVCSSLNDDRPPSASDPSSAYSSRERFSRWEDVREALSSSSSEEAMEASGRLAGDLTTDKGRAESVKFELWSRGHESR